MKGKIIPFRAALGKDRPGTEEPTAPEKKPEAKQKKTAKTPPSKSPEGALFPLGIAGASGKVLSPAASARAEAAGIQLIAAHWLEALGDMGAACASFNFLDRLSVQIAKVMLKGHGPYGPRSFEVRKLNKITRRIALDRENTLLMRYKAGFHSFTNLEANAHKMVIDPYEPKEWISKPRHATHYRFFQTIGALCDYHYHPELHCYVPSRPDLIGVTSIEYSETLTIAGSVLHPIEITDVLPGFPEMGDDCEIVVGVGVEFLHHGKGKLVPRVEMRVMHAF